MKKIPYRVEIRPLASKRGYKIAIQSSTDGSITDVRSVDTLEGLIALIVKLYSNKDKQRGGLIDDHGRIYEQI